MALLFCLSKPPSLAPFQASEGATVTEDSVEAR